MNKDLKLPTTIDYEFGQFCLTPSERSLKRNEKIVSLPPKVFDALVILVENPGRLIEKDEFLDRLWDKTFVEEATLARTISRLRKTLGKENRYIETVAKSGYRFTEPVNVKDSVNETIRNSEDSSSKNESNDVVNPPRPNNQNDLAEHWHKKPQLLFIGGMVLISAIALAIIWQYDFYGVKDARSIKSIAVLPFRTLGNDEKDKALEVAMADALITKLGSIEKIVVLPTSAIYRYAEKDDLNLTTIGRELDVEAILDGTIQKDGRRLRVNVQLVNVSNGIPLWSDKFDSENKDIFVLQDNISEQVTNALELKLTGQEKEVLTKRYTENREAYEAYIKGRYLWNERNPKDFKQSLELFEKAIEIDPNYALAYTGIADCYQLFAEYRMLPINEGFAKARSAARKALELDESLAEAHASLGYTLAFHDWDFETAEKEFRRAIELNPNYSTARQWYSELLAVVGRFEEMRDEIEKAQKLDPLSPSISSDVVAYYFMTEKYDEAIEFSKKTIELEQEFSWGHRFLSASYNGKGDQKETVYSFLKVIELSHGESIETIQRLKDVFDKDGWKPFWQAWIKQMDSSDKIYLAWDYAITYLRFDDKENTLKWLEKSYVNRERWIINIKYEPRFAPLHSDPRFQDIVRRIGLKPKK